MRQRRKPLFGRDVRVVERCLCQQRVGTETIAKSSVFYIILCARSETVGARLWETAVHNETGFFAVIIRKYCYFADDSILLHTLVGNEYQDNGERVLSSSTGSSTAPSYLN